MVLIKLFTQMSASLDPASFTQSYKRKRCYCCYPLVYVPAAFEVLCGCLHKPRNGSLSQSSFEAAGGRWRLPAAEQEDEVEVMCLRWLMAVDKGSVTNMGNRAACIYFTFYSCTCSLLAEAH